MAIWLGLPGKPLSLSLPCEGPSNTYIRQTDHICSDVLEQLVEGISVPHHLCFSMLSEPLANAQPYFLDDRIGAQDCNHCR